MFRDFQGFIDDRVRCPDRNLEQNNPKLSIKEQYLPFAVGNSERIVPVLH